MNNNDFNKWVVIDVIGDLSVSQMMEGRSSCRVFDRDTLTITGPDGMGIYAAKYGDTLLGYTDPDSSYEAVEDAVKEAKRENLLGGALAEYGDDSELLKLLVHR